VLACNEFSEVKIKDFNHHLDKAELELFSMFKSDQKWEDVSESDRA
jgi:hypothetical protein